MLGAHVGAHSADTPGHPSPELPIPDELATFAGFPDAQSAKAAWKGFDAMSDADVSNRYVAMRVTAVMLPTSPEDAWDVNTGALCADVYMNPAMMADRPIAVRLMALNDTRHFAAELRNGRLTADQAAFGVQVYAIYNRLCHLGDPAVTSPAHGDPTQPSVAPRND